MLRGGIVADPPKAHREGLGSADAAPGMPEALDAAPGMPEALTVPPVLTMPPVLTVPPEPLPADRELPEEESLVASRPPHAAVTMRKKETDDH
jgi:hypothetical protein